ncbi:uncharacterized protein MKK02DRAFT_44716 [Dioszegia hungarica]|uniref:Succinate dehydrogenase assembly factor 4, mitochondrial n=1 Tax=Dioszegia hungarica TaxID=4972 RepID=A0AA38H8P7_9TREE|nr:uncharacterized protein MKK02DRAFT_44716 [Dioszegia hungarica]KAI9636018.1 hypothetical protein MKK02DRAFT_44716 [Dioszegia hungarica]
MSALLRSVTIPARSIAGPSRLPLLRPLSSTATHLRNPQNYARPGPPSLPPKEQAEFDALVKANETHGATPAITKPASEIEHRDIRRGPRAEFDGDINPKTGEQGGPKVDPFKAGDGDWQYAGRVTDF